MLNGYVYTYDSLSLPCHIQCYCEVNTQMTAHFKLHVFRLLVTHLFQRDKYEELCRKQRVCFPLTRHC
jgi:hypothetical protein